MRQGQGWLESDLSFIPCHISHTDCHACPRRAAEISIFISISIITDSRSPSLYVKHFIVRNDAYGVIAVTPADNWITDAGIESIDSEGSLQETGNRFPAI